MLHRALIILSLTLGLNAFASDGDFQGLMEKSDYKGALQIWNETYGDSSFAQSDNGKATLGFLLIQNQMPLAGFDLIFATNPSKLSASLRKSIATEMKNSIFVQKGWVQTRGGWKKIFNNEPIQISIRDKKDVAKAFAKANAMARDNVNAKARVWWKIATLAPQINEVDSSVKALKLLKESGQTVIGQDLISSALARVLYQKGDLAAATNYFNEIPKSSSLWIESLEERAWTAFRADDYDKAVGESVTLLSPALAPLAGPETFYLANLLSLKICDYSRIFKNSDTFKKRQMGHLQAIQDLSKTGTNKDLELVLGKIDGGGVNLQAVGASVTALPRAALRDSKFVKFMETRREWIKESQNKQTAITIPASLGEQYKKLAVDRLKVLAGHELKEYRQVIDKMHIIEGEVIQRLAVDENLKGQRSKLAKNEDPEDKLVFPYSNDEVWFDELDNYKARVKDCPTLKGAGL
jgi:hypothetical protein